ncbi:MAG TPA: YCF48-related protein [Fimbriimonadaceae bacterium]|nr:YCF48-related protein [Fimbriimonadaceae bacterium]
MQCLAVLALPVLALSQGQLKNPPSKSEEHAKHHAPITRGMPAAVRLAAYEHRLRMEAESPFSQIHWRNIGPDFQGGRVVDIESPEGRPELMFVAYATGGLWVTSDEGQSWTPRFDNESAFAIGDIAVSRSGETIWVGTGENNSQRTSYSGTGVFKSTDAGKTWTNMGLHESHRIGRVLIDPRNENVVWVGAVGALYSANPERGVYKTDDGGRTWRHVLKLNDLTGVIDLAMDPFDPAVVYAAAWERDRRAWNFREGGSGSGIYKTSDGGKTWTRLTTGLPTGDLGRVGLATARSKRGVVYALVDNQNPDPDTINRDEFTPSGVLTARRFKLMNREQFLQVDRAVLGRFFQRYLPAELKVEDVLTRLREGKMSLEDVAAEMERRNAEVFSNEIVDSEVYRSDDGGRTWRRTHAGLMGEHLGYYCGRISVNPRDENDVVIMGTILLRSKDGGKTWSQIAREVHVDHHAYWFDPRNPTRQANGNDGGFYLSANDGRSWRHINNVPVGQFTTIALDNKTPYNVVGGLQDNGTLLGPSNWVRPSSLTAGSYSRVGWRSIGGGDGSAVAFDWKDDDIVYVASQFGNHSGLNLRTNERWQIRPRPRPGEPALRFNWVSPLIVSPHHPDILYLGSQKLHRSLDKGRTWEDLSGDLTKNRPNGDVPFSTLKDISESPFKFGVVIVGADDGTVKITRDHGATWQNIPTPTPDKWVTRVVASKWDPATFYVAQNGYREDDFAPYLWKSTDYGRSWTSIVGNLPAEQINVIREDPRRKNILYVGTGLGVFVTFDGGGMWEPLHGGIPRTPVHDLAIHPREEELAIATHARSVFILPLKQVYKVTPELRSKELQVAAPEPWTRGNLEYRPRQPWDTSLPESPKVQIEVWSARPAKATVQVVDSSGKSLKTFEADLVRGFNFVELDTELSPARPRAADPKSRPKATAEEILKDPYEVERPRYIPVGAYKIRVQVGDRIETVDWQVRQQEGGEQRRGG